jgi:membrane protease YdiL (CAAX protease family)
VLAQLDRLVDAANAKLFPRTRPGWLPKDAAREAIVLWAVCFAAVLIGFAINKPLGKVFATVGFLYLPLHAITCRGEDWPDYGLSMRTLGRDLKMFAIMAAIVFPLFIGGYVVFTEWVLPQLPQNLIRLLTPYPDGRVHFQFRLPDRFTEWVIDDLFVVALPEEFFYRGYIQGRLRDAWPGGKLFLGARLGPAFWVTAILFALGHLAIFEVWRLAVFFPALLFGWMRERTNSVVAGALFHAASNILIKVLDASFFGA